MRMGLKAAFTKPSPMKVKKVMGEFKKGTLNSGDKKGPIVKNRMQAIAIALNSGKKKGMA